MTMQTIILFCLNMQVHICNISNQKWNFFWKEPEMHVRKMVSINFVLLQDYSRN